MIKILCLLFLFLLLFSNCQTSKSANLSGEENIKIAVYNENDWDFIKNLILYRGYDVEIIFYRNFLTFRNINENELMDILMVLRQKADIIANNLANVNTTRTSEGGVFRRSFMVITAEYGIEIQQDLLTEPRFVYDPTHPDSIVSGKWEGYVEMPNVDIVTEMVNLIFVQRLHEQVLEFAKSTFRNIIW